MEHDESTQDLEALRERWTSEQMDLARECKFYDDELPFSVTSKTTPEEGSSGEDFDEPVVRSESIGTIDVEGLNYVGGLDISFVGSEDATGGSKEGTEGLPDAYATIAVLEYPSMKLRHELTEPIHLNTPYIPSFLAYREAPTYLSLLEKLRTKLQQDGKENEFPQLLVVDGNGRLHVREAGSACAVGVRSGLPTIGVAKNYHPPHGSPEKEGDEKANPAAMGGGWRATQKGMRQMAQKVLKQQGDWIGLHRQSVESPVASRNAYIGAAVLSSKGAKNPIFVSPAHRVSLRTAILLALVMSKVRVPEPTRKADEISRIAVRKALAQTPKTDS
ncbi:hypothetical protein M407DRAFT_222543 [Tulasnella calospora MUT 4182]|uniref:Endonuclease V n=1 Tax=Tulasnella calospora MUT 4182 TaxID=1051891 RepID=A0A0C3QGR6_9AGAM|nr:hypothetical protein M407DRAFT_222543 [Tulasnella calospora MUT 4182]